MNKAMCFVISLVILWSSGMILAAQSSSQTASDKSQEVLHSDQVLRTNTRLVVVDVVATDNRGELIGDLKADDVTMLEDGKAQKISSFTFHPPGKTEVAISSHLPANVVTNAPAFQSSSLNVMLLDTLNGDFAGQSYVKDQLLKYLSRAELAHPVAVFAMESHLVMLHDFTTDPMALKSSVEKFKTPARFISGETATSRASAFTTFGDSHTSERDIATTLNQLNALAKTLAGYPGRKNLIWLSEGFPLNLFPDITNKASSGFVPPSKGRTESSNAGMGGGIQGGTIGNGMEGTGAGAFKDYGALVKKVSDALMKAQVAIYVVDAGAIGKDERMASHSTMNDMAERTGGKAFIGTNDLSGSMSSSVDDGSTYYTVEYYPDNKKWDGQFRTIQLKSNRAGVKLRYRQGYYALDPEKLSKENADAVAENFSRSLELDAPAATQVVFQAQVVPPSANSKKVMVTFHIDPGTLAFQHKEGGMETARMSCTVWAYGKDKDKPTMSSGTVNANLKAGEFQQIMQQHFLPCDRELDLKPGAYTLRMGVLDRTTNKMGTASTQLIVP